MSKSISRPVGALAAVLALVGLAACSGPSDDGDTIKIGFLSPLSGPIEPAGADMKRGAELAVQHKSEIDGKEVELIARDTAFDPDRAVSEAQKLVTEDGVDAIAGIYGSSEMLALLGVSERLQVPLMTTNSGAVEITGAECSPYAFRSQPNDAMSATAAGTVLEASSEYRDLKWFILGSDYAWGYSMADSFKEIEGIDIVGEAFVPTDTVDFASQISSIRNSGANAVYLPILTGNSQLQALQQIREFGLSETALIVPPIGVPESVMQGAPDAVVGTVSTARWGAWSYETESADLEAFNIEYFDTYGETPSFQAINAYIGVTALLDAIDEAGDTEADAIIQALEGGTFDTLYGEITFRASDHQANSPAFFGEIIRMDEPKYGTDLKFEIASVVPGDEILNDSECSL